MSPKGLVLIAVASLCVLAGLGDCTKGVDVSSYVSKTNWECLKGQGYEFVIVRAYRSIGSPDPNAVGTLSNARAAGFQYADVYLFPCPKCSKSASDQVTEMGMNENVQVTDKPLNKGTERGTILCPS